MTQELPAQQALKGLLALLELQVRQGLPAQPDQLETLAALGRQAQLGRLARLALRARLALLALRGLLV